jgi:hypothetical protein
MQPRFDRRQRRAIIVFGSIWAASLAFATLVAMLGGRSP